MSQHRAQCPVCGKHRAIVRRGVAKPLTGERIVCVSVILGSARIECESCRKRWWVSLK